MLKYFVMHNDTPLVYRKDNKLQHIFDANLKHRSNIIHALLNIPHIGCSSISMIDATKPGNQLMHAIYFAAVTCILDNSM